MNKNLSPSADAQSSVGQAPQVPVSPPEKEAFKASTLILLLSIVGLIGTVSVACLVWYLVADWKNAEHLLEKESHSLEQPSPVVNSVGTYLLAAKAIRPSALRAKSTNREDAFAETKRLADKALTQHKPAFRNVQKELKQLNTMCKYET